MADPRTEALRDFFSRYVVAVGRAREPRIQQAFAAVQREIFAGPGPWSVCVPELGYLDTPNDDVAFLYQDTLIALDAARGINIGQPSAHARWLESLAARTGETIVQIGAGSGYYTTILAHLVGSTGRVHAYEIDPALAARATANLTPCPWVTLHAQSGLTDELPAADAIYVNAGLGQPISSWLDALRKGGRLLFPLQSSEGFGGMLLIRKTDGPAWPARFVSPAAFVACVTTEDPTAAGRLAAAFERGGSETVRSIRFDGVREDTCWFAGNDWWLSTTEAT